MTTIEFAIIPMEPTFLSSAYEVQTKLQNNVKINMRITIDTNYESSIVSRINKWRKQEYDIITIDRNYDDSNSIVVRFSDKGSKAQVMNVDEFIEVVASFEDDDKEQKIEAKGKNDGDNNENNNGDNDEDNDEDNDGGCILS